MKKGILLGFLMLCMAVFVVPEVSLAASTSGANLNLNTVTIQLNPDTPKPNSAVTATVRSNGVELSSADIIWILDDEPISGGSGITSVTFQSGDLGETMQLSVGVKTLSGMTLGDTITIRPAQAFLAWEAQTLTPPLFAGRALYSNDSTVRFEVFADLPDAQGNLTPREDLVYTWRRGSTLISGASGVGKSTLAVVGPKFMGSEVYSVEVATQDDVSRSVVGALIKSVDPYIVLYEYDPALGTRFAHALSDAYSTSGSVLTIEAIPLYADASSARAATLLYEWSVGGKDIDTPTDNPSRISFAASEREGLVSALSVTITHAMHILARTTRDISVRFGASSGSSLFGF